jgi:hypothetical protein
VWCVRGDHTSWTPINQSASQLLACGWAAGWKQQWMQQQAAAGKRKPWQQQHLPEGTDCRVYLCAAASQATVAPAPTCAWWNPHSCAAGSSLLHINVPLLGRHDLPLQTHMTYERPPLLLLPPPPPT